jgi:DNA recombination protein RmuC
MGILYLIIGIIIGAVAAYLIAKSKFVLPSGITLDSYTLLDKQKSILEETKRKSEEDLTKTEKNLVDERNKNQSLSNEKAKLQTELDNVQERMSEQKGELDQLQKTFQKEFENIANKILEKNSEKFTEQNRVNLDVILNPLKEKIKDFEEKVDKTYKSESSERISLKEQIKNLLDLNKQLSQDANNLAVALKGDTKKQGNWGELVLEKILEASGLSKDRGEYKTQVLTENADGDKIKPDVIVFLPDNKHLIIDSKVSLLAYNNFIASSTDEDKTIYAKQHLDSVRSHIKLLGDKNYETAFGFSVPDFVMLFMPMESAFSLALQTDSDLFNYAWERKIVIVSPTTLLATLRTVASIWKQERQVKHALQIADEGGKLYDKFVSFVDDLISVGKKMEDARGSYSEAMKKLHEGSGNLVNRAEKMKQLGAKATKNLNQGLLDRANEISIEE